MSASFGQRGSRRRVAAWLLAVVGPALLTIVSLPFRGELQLAGFLMLALLLVIAVAVVGGVWPALATVILGSVAGSIFFAPPYGSLSVQLRLHNVPLIAYLIVGGVLGFLVDDLAAVANEQAALRRVDAALRRVATLVARAVPTDELFAATTQEVGKLLGVDRSRLARLEPDGTTTILAEWAENGNPIPAGADVVAGDADDDAAISAPIVVEARPWGVMTAGAARDRTLPPGTQTRLARFTELLATAIANAQSRDELAASRARIVAASDHTRRQIERDLHDGAQQRLVSLTLALRKAQRAVPAELFDLRQALSGVADGLAGVMEELREMARGIHPAALAEGGIAPALGNLARRSPIPVELEVNARRASPRAGARSPSTTWSPRASRTSSSTPTPHPQPWSWTRPTESCGSRSGTTGAAARIHPVGPGSPACATASRRLAAGSTSKVRVGAGRTFTPSCRCSFRSAEWRWRPRQLPRHSDRSDRPRIVEAWRRAFLLAGSGRRLPTGVPRWTVASKTRALPSGILTTHLAYISTGRRRPTSDHVMLSLSSQYRRRLAHARARRLSRRLSRTWVELNYAQARLTELQTGGRFATNNIKGRAK